MQPDTEQRPHKVSFSIHEGQAEEVTRSLLTSLENHGVKNSPVSVRHEKSKMQTFEAVEVQGIRDSRWCWNFYGHSDWR